MISDKKRFAIARKDLIHAVQKARTLDNLLVVIKRKYFELTGGSDPYNIGSVTQRPPAQVSHGVPPAPPPPSTAPPPPPPEGVPPPPPLGGPPPLSSPPPPPPTREVSQVVKCPHCGEPLDLDRDIIFCPNCGTPRE
ncbi:MAG: zinc-ribbon domain-containing protein [Candidatus Helarchaeota archaeon]|nr:zinc-ribbon domain-containing protein [Candidatus Helarchaeota archaeon]